MCLILLECPGCCCCWNNVFYFRLSLKSIWKLKLVKILWLSDGSCQSNLQTILASHLYPIQFWSYMVWALGILKTLLPKDPACSCQERFCSVCHCWLKLISLSCTWGIVLSIVVPLKLWKSSIREIRLQIPFRLYWRASKSRTLMLGY